MTEFKTKAAPASGKEISAAEPKSSTTIIVEETKIASENLQSSPSADENNTQQGENISSDAESPQESLKDNQETVEDSFDLPEGFLLTDDKLLYQKDPSKDEFINVCSRLEVRALARDKNSEQWSKLVVFKDFDGKDKEILLPSSLLASDGKDLRERLLNAGLNIYPDGRSYLTKYLAYCNPSKRVLSVDQTGWTDDFYVFPNQVVGNPGIDVRFTHDTSFDPYEVKGTTEEWKEHIGKRCSGNSRLIFAVCTAFSSLLLSKLNVEGCGYHFVGPSSCGKSTILSVAASVFGGKPFVRSWRATDNGLEGVAALHNDSLLCLDEISQSSKCSDIPYLLANGKGKTRATKSGKARQALSWRLLFLSNGETNLDTMGKVSKSQINAGQEIRLLNIPAIPYTQDTGAFENIHSEVSGGEFAKKLKQATEDYHGAVVIDFLKAVISRHATIKDEFAEFCQKFYKGMNQKNAQLERALEKIALNAFSGELATQAGLTGWKEGECTAVMQQCFNEWVEYRGGDETYERMKLLKQVRAFFERNLYSNFVSLDQGDTINKELAGFRQKTNFDNTACFWVFPTVFTEVICSGFDENYAKKVLCEEGWLTQEVSKTKTVNSQTYRVYEFTRMMFT